MAVIPYPKEETTPPVTKIYFVILYPPNRMFSSNSVLHFIRLEPESNLPPHELLKAKNRKPVQTINHLKVFSESHAGYMNKNKFP